jgi:hypothetical protein
MCNGGLYSEKFHVNDAACIAFLNEEEVCDLVAFVINKYENTEGVETDENYFEELSRFFTKKLPPSPFLEIIRMQRIGNCSIFNLISALSYFFASNADDTNDPTSLLGTLFRTAGKNIINFYSSHEPTTAFENIVKNVAYKQMKKILPEAAQQERIRNMPKWVTVPAHEHQLQKTGRVYEHNSGFYKCDLCGEDGNGWVYHCDTCNFDAHLQCAESNMTSK